MYRILFSFASSPPLAYLYAVVADMLEGLGLPSPYIQTMIIAVDVVIVVFRLMMHNSNIHSNVQTH